MKLRQSIHTFMLGSSLYCSWFFFNQYGDATQERIRIIESRPESLTRALDDFDSAKVRVSVLTDLVTSCYEIAATNTTERTVCESIERELLAPAQEKVGELALSDRLYNARQWNEENVDPLRNKKKVYGVATIFSVLFFSAYASILKSSEIRNSQDKFPAIPLAGGKK